jgi:uncharacterized protein (DUF1501 family)
MTSTRTSTRTSTPISTPISRRRFLQGAAAVGASTAFAPQIALAATEDPVGDTLVLVLLRGGMDGLTALVPCGEGAAYYDARRHVAVAEGATLPIDERFGLHPALAPLHELFVDGQLAFVPALGSPHASRSHFDQQRMLEHGTAALHSGAMGASGWLARHLASRPSHPLQAIAGLARLPEVLEGTPSAVAIRSLSWLTDRLQRTGDLATGGSVLRALSGDAPLGTAADASAATATTLLSVSMPADAYDGYPDEHGARSLHDVARLLAAGVSIDAAVVDFGGWDLHAGMGDARQGPMRTRLAALAASLARFHEETASLSRPVTVVAVSEFGRTLLPNASGGTDHGRGGLLLALGRGVNGGVHGTWPGLTSDVLDGGDLAVANDYRDPLAEVVRVRLGNPDLATVFPDHDPQVLGIVRSP